jgi:mannose-1-phosphate guanylyltransferase
MLPCGKSYQGRSSKSVPFSVEDNMRRPADQQVRCGIVLAAGEGKRLEPLVRQLRGDSLPKQYVTFIGRRSMLEHTFARIETMIPRDRVFTVISREHQNYPAVRQQLAGRAAATVIEQPENKETAAGILLPLIHVYKRYREATVAIFPSDHFVFEEELFMSHVAVAFQAVEENPSLMVLLGIEPSECEPEYGYILPNGAGDQPNSLTLQRVGSFIEKPSPEAAREMMAKGALWNTMVMVFKVKNLLAIVEKMTPDLYGAFQEILRAIGTRDEKSRVRKIYRNLDMENFSKGILQKLPMVQPASLSVLAVRGVLWSDWGLPRSIEAVLRKIDEQESVGQPRVSESLWKSFSDRLRGNRPEVVETKKRSARREEFKRFPGRVIAPLPPR